MSETFMDKDTRERPKKTSYRAVTRLPKTRTKSGCFTCRKRKKKCDEHGPVCQGCARNFLKCVWPSNPSETLPKDFKISSCTDDFDSKHSPHIVTTPKKFETKMDITDTEGVDDAFIDMELPNVPANLCSVMEITSYKHKIPYPTTTTIPESIDFVIDSISGNDNSNSSDGSVQPLDESTYVNHQTISQMFNSLYNKSIDSVDSNGEHPEFYDDLLNYNSKTSFTYQSENSSIKNPILAAFREIFFARGCLYLAKSNEQNKIDDSITENDISKKYNLAAEKHYESSISLIKDYVNPCNFTMNTKSSNNNSINEHWMVFAIERICEADHLLGLVSENCISNLIEIEQGSSPVSMNSVLSSLDNSSLSVFNKVLFSQLLFVYPFLIYFSDFNSVLNLKSPSTIYQNYNKDMVEIFLMGDSNNESAWLIDVLTTALINILQNLTKMLWLLRMKNSTDSVQFKNSLYQLKSEISVIWTTIQTAEIQLEREDVLVDFAKLSHMASEILYLAISDPSINTSSPIIGFYLDQFISNYGSYMKNSHIDGNHNKNIARCFFILPLFIAACSAESAYQREFISKELYSIANELGYEAIENLTISLERSWCDEKHGGVSTFSKLASGDGFSQLLRTI